MPSHVTVTAPPGRLTPIHPDDGSGVGGLRLTVDPDHVARVRWSPTTRRAHKRGDLILCKLDGTPVKTPDEAAAPVDIGHPRKKEIGK